MLYYFSMSFILYILYMSFILYVFIQGVHNNFDHRFSQK